MSAKMDNVHTAACAAWGPAAVVSSYGINAVSFLFIFGDLLFLETFSGISHDRGTITAILQSTDVPQHSTAVHDELPA